MAFRRQDIPKTTRRGKEGEPRRIYPRYLRDASYLPKIALAIDYLDGMVGRRRGDLSPDAVLDLLGDPKLARCILSCLSDTYRYRTPEFAEVVGEETALRLAGWDLFTAADVRDLVYRTLNARHQGVIDPAARSSFLNDIGETLGVDDEVLDQLLHLDAERNAVLVRNGERPRPEDVVARFNALLTFSVLRQASTIDLELPGLPATTVATVCARWDVSHRRTGRDSWRLSGRKDALGSWARFGLRLARCAVHLLMLPAEIPSGLATVHLGEQTSRFVIDAKAVATLRPRCRAAAGPEGLIRAAVLADELTAARRGPGEIGRGWTIRRAMEPIVAEGTVVLPELLFVRGLTVVSLVMADRPDSDPAGEAVRRAQTMRPIVAHGNLADFGAVPVVRTAGDVWSLLERLDAAAAPPATPVERLRDELIATGWVKDERVVDVLGDDVPKRIRPLVEDGDAALVPGFGLCRIAVLDEWGDRYLGNGEVDVRVLREELTAQVGDSAAADALTLHLLSRQPLFANVRAEAA
jgi:predicted nuclease of restriction endonuclease-like RecB superfamily